MSAEIIAAGIGAASSMLGGLFSNKANSNLNKSNRIWQEQMMYAQDRLNKENYQQQLNDTRQLSAENNLYNSPSEEIARLKKAGINPDLYYNNSGLGSAAQTATLPSMNGASAASSPSSIPMQNVGQSALESSQIALNMANAKKANAEAEGQEIDNFTNMSTQDARIALENGKVVQQDIEIEFGELGNDLRRTEIEKEKTLIGNLAESTNYLKQLGLKTAAEAKLLATQEQMAAMQLHLFDVTFNHQVEEIVNTCKISREQAANAQMYYYWSAVGEKEKALACRTAAAVDQYKLDWLMPTEFAGMAIDNQRVAFNLSQAKDWDNVERWQKVITGSINTAADAAYKLSKTYVNVKAGKRIGAIPDDGKGGMTVRIFDEDSQSEFAITEDGTVVTGPRASERASEIKEWMRKHDKESGSHVPMPRQ